MSKLSKSSAELTLSTSVAELAEVLANWSRTMANLDDAQPGFPSSTPGASPSTGPGPAPADRRHDGVSDVVGLKDTRSYDKLTIDHIDPDGPNTVDNLVIACLECNSIKKKKRSLEEAGMTLLPEPRIQRLELLGHLDEPATDDHVDQAATRPGPDQDQTTDQDACVVRGLVPGTTDHTTDQTTDQEISRVRERDARDSGQDLVGVWSGGRSGGGSGLVGGRGPGLVGGLVGEAVAGLHAAGLLPDGEPPPGGDADDPPDPPEHEGANDGQRW